VATSESHSDFYLDTRVAGVGMLEGHFRRERAQNYVKFLEAFFGRVVHKAALVIGVRHGAIWACHFHFNNRKLEIVCASPSLVL
jgi:hypothetical protein